MNDEASNIPYCNFRSHRIGIVENYKHTVKIGETNIDYNGKKLLQPFDIFFKKTCQMTTATKITM